VQRAASVVAFLFGGLFSGLFGGLFGGLVCGLALAPAAEAQVFYGSDGTLQDNWRLDQSTGVSVGPEFSNVFVSGLADDEAAQVFYIATGATLSSANFGSAGAPVTTLGTTTYLAATRSFTGLAFQNGVLYASHNTGLEGLFTIDLVTLATTLVYQYPNQEIALEGMDFDPVTGLLYGANDGGAYVDPTGAPGRGVVTIDLTQPTVVERLAFPYPFGRTDIDGLAFDPAGRVYLIEDEVSDLHNFDVLTGTYDPTPPMNAAPGAAVFAGGTYEAAAPTSIGINYCGAELNSVGLRANLLGIGSPIASQNTLTLRAQSVVPNQFVLFLTSRTQSFVQNPGNSQGNLCLGGAIGRFVRPGQIKNSGPAGSAELILDLTQLPTPTAFVAVQAGETWNFQAWYRDVASGQPSSNFTDGLSVAFQ